MYKVKLQSFEGPFDLLVYLIENAEITKYNNKEKDCLIILDKKKRREAYV